MKPIKVNNVNTPDKEFIDKLHMLIAKSIIRELGISNTEKLLDIFKEKNHKEKNN